MASGNTIIVGGGIASGTPFTTNQFALIGNSSPATIIDANARQDTSTPPKVFIGDSAYTAGATVIGGGTTNVVAQKSIVIGDAASYLPAGYNYSGVVIGRNATAIGFGGAIVIGHAAVSTGPNGDVVVIGRSANTTVDSSVVIGAQANATVGGQSIAIGFGAVTSGGLGNIVIGTSANASGATAIVIGPSSATNKTRNILIGPTVVDNNTAGNNVFIGNSFASLAGDPGSTVGFFNSTPYTTFIVGNAFRSGAPSSLLFRLPDGSGANIAAGSLTIRPGIATGAGAQGSIALQTQNAVGAASVLGTVITQVSIVPSTGAAGQANLRIDNVTSGAAAAVGTLNNAPSAGDPTFWLPVNIAGNIRYIPCWT
jgi:hypothetical protein